MAASVCTDFIGSFCGPVGRSAGPPVGRSIGGPCDRRTNGSRTGRGGRAGDRDGVRSARRVVPPPPLPSICPFLSLRRRAPPSFPLSSVDPTDGPTDRLAVLSRSERRKRRRVRDARNAVSRRHVKRAESRDNVSYRTHAAVQREARAALQTTSLY